MQTSMKLYDKETGAEIKPGDTVTTTRGTYVFQCITREPEYGKTGRVYVKDGDQDREYYPTVLNAEIR